MGLFRTSLEDAKKCLAERDFHKAMKILKERETDCQYAWSDLLGVKRSLISYEKALGEAITDLDREMNAKEPDFRLLDKRVDNILHYLHLMKKHLKGLIHEGKILIN